MDYAIIESGAVVNVIVADADFAAEVGAVPLEPGFGIGDLFDGTDWTKATQEPTEQPVLTSAMVNAERDRRIAAGFSFNSVRYDFDARAKANISGAAQLAFMAIVAGAEAGDPLWNGGPGPFSWIAADNTLVTMDAQTVVEFGRAAAQHEQAHIFAARALKDLEPIPLDYTDDAYWP